jgi:hypothetical protein
LSTASRPPTARWRRFWKFAVVFGISELVWAALIVVGGNGDLSSIGVIQVGITVVTGVLLIAQGLLFLRAAR